MGIAKFFGDSISYKTKWHGIRLSGIFATREMLVLRDCQSNNYKTFKYLTISGKLTDMRN